MQGTTPIIIIIAALNLLFTSIALAQSSDPDTRFSLGTIEVITVQGARHADWHTPLQARLGSEEMRMFERNDVSAALSLLPGISVQNVGARSEKLVHLRGFNSRQVPLFIDGVPVYVPYDGNFDLSRLLTFDIAEITIGKGFSSMLYGANTLGGSINIVSQRPREGLSASLRNGFYVDDGGDTSSSNHALSLGNANSNWYVQGHLSWSEQDFFTLPAQFTPTLTENGGRRNNSASEDRKLSLKLGFTPKASDEYALSYQRNEGRKNTAPYAGTEASYRARYWRWPDYDKESLYFISRTGLGAHEYVRVRLYHDTFYNLLRSFDDAHYRTQHRPYAFNSVYDDYSQGASIELGSTRLTDHRLRAALQLKHDVHRERDAATPTQAMRDKVLSLGLEDAWTLSPTLSVITGLGWDRQEGRRADDLQGNTLVPFQVASAEAWNAQAALTYSIDASWSAHASVARRTRFPTIKDRYSYRMGTAIPNPALAPEYALNAELGITGNLSLVGSTQLQLSAALFRSRITDAIESINIADAECSSSPCSQLQNIAQQDNNGLELAFTALLSSAIEIHGNYTYLERDNTSNSALRALDTPRHQLFAYLQYSPLATVDLVLSGQHESKRYSSSDGLRRTTAFSSADFKAIWRLDEHLQVEAGGRNLSDELYAFEEGFPEAGRTWFLNINMSY